MAPLSEGAPGLRDSSPSADPGSVVGALAADEGGEVARLELDDRLELAPPAFVRLLALQSLEELFGEQLPRAGVQAAIVVQPQVGAPAEQGEGRAGDDHLAELFDQVEREAGLARTVD